MNKKTILIISFLGIIAAGLIVYWLFFTPAAPAQNGQNKQGFFSFLFPSSSERAGDSQPTTQNGNINNGDSQTTISSIAPTKQKLIQLTSNAVAGAVFNSKTQKIQYFEKSTGHLYETNPTGEVKNQLTITTIPRIFEVYWNKEVSKALLRYFESENNIIRAFLISSVSTTTGTVEGSFLSTDIKAVSVSGEEQKIFYLTESETTTGIIATIDNKNQKQIFSSPFGEFLVNWPIKDRISLLTKPSSESGGYLYELNTTTQTVTKILGDINGLTVLYSPIPGKILYSEAENSSINTKIYDTKKKSSVIFNQKTFPEKCVFSKLNSNKIYCAVPQILTQGDYPDIWYKGLISFVDNLWTIDMGKGSSEMILNEGNFDMINLFLDSEEKFLFFENKKDGNLWSINLAI